MNLSFKNFILFHVLHFHCSSSFLSLQNSWVKSFGWEMLAEIVQCIWFIRQPLLPRSERWLSLERLDEPLEATSRLRTPVMDGVRFFLILSGINLWRVPRTFQKRKGRAQDLGWKLKWRQPEVRKDALRDSRVKRFGACAILLKTVVLEWSKVLVFCARTCNCLACGLTIDLLNIC